MTPPCVGLSAFLSLTGLALMSIWSTPEVLAGARWEARSAYVVVLDASDAPVTGLTAADIVIMEDGAARTVTEVVPAPDPIAIALLVDTTQPRMGSSAPTRDLRAGLTAFMTIVQTANPESEIAVVQTGGAAVMSQNFTTKARDLTRAINRLIPSQRTSAVVLEALVDMGKAMGKLKTTRRAIVSIDFDTPDTSGVQSDQISTAVHEAGAAIWAISVRGQGLSAGREAVLDAVTEMTGGLRLTAVSPSALEAQLTTIARALTSQYLVTYERPDGGSVTRVRAAATKGSKFLATRVMVK